jgi:hypothetical protein
LIEIAVVSSRNIEDVEFSERQIQDSIAEVFIDQVKIYGTEHGGAAKCVPCPDGTFSSEPTSKCSQCPLG